jgi:magnesium-protoporphyrin O-methyltransferase
MMMTTTYATRRTQLETYFDDTANEAWVQLTSNVPVSGIRKTVRAGRAQTRDTLLSWLPADLSSARILDAGCGTGALAEIAAERGARVVATDVSASLIDVAIRRTTRTARRGSLAFIVGDMLDPTLGVFDHVVAMDSLIHYDEEDVLDALAEFATRTSHSIVFTHAPRTPLLMAMHTAGRFFPRADRAPAIEPISTRHLGALIADDPRFAGWSIARTRRISSGFYVSQAVELTRG